MYRKTSLVRILVNTNEEFIKPLLSKHEKSQFFLLILIIIGQLNKKYKKTNVKHLIHHYFLTDLN